MMDEHLTMSTHISNLCRSAMTAIRKIGRFANTWTGRPLLHLSMLFVTSRLDSCNALLANLTEKDIGKLQRLQNIAARIVQRARHHEHITPILSALHWLPIDKRIKFKIILLTFKALNGTAPTYISDILHTYITLLLALFDLSINISSKLLDSTPSTMDTDLSASRHPYYGTNSLQTYANSHLWTHSKMP